MFSVMFWRGSIMSQKQWKIVYNFLFGRSRKFQRRLTNLLTDNILLLLTVNHTVFLPHRLLGTSLLNVLELLLSSSVFRIAPSRQLRLPLMCSNKVYLSCHQNHLVVYEYTLFFVIQMAIEIFTGTLRSTWSTTCVNLLTWGIFWKLNVF